jgi:uncharacterized phage-associated protein
MITFQFKPEKFASAVAYLAAGAPGRLSKKQICKLLYFADKTHLLRCGRPITGDRYHALPHGHVPTKGLDILNGREQRVGPEAINALRRYGRMDGWFFHLERAADLKVFSRTDLDALDETIKAFAHLSADELEQMSHREQSWLRTEPNRPIDFDLFFEGHPEAVRVREALSSQD